MTKSVSDDAALASVVKRVVDNPDLLKAAVEDLGSAALDACKRADGWTLRERKGLFKRTWIFDAAAFGGRVSAEVVAEDGKISTTRLIDAEAVKEAPSPDAPAAPPPSAAPTAGPAQAAPPQTTPAQAFPGQAATATPADGAPLGQVLSDTLAGVRTILASGDATAIAALHAACGTGMSAHQAATSALAPSAAPAAQGVRPGEVPGSMDPAELDRRHSFELRFYDQDPDAVAQCVAALQQVEPGIVGFVDAGKADASRNPRTPAERDLIRAIHLLFDDPAARDRMHGNRATESVYQKFAAGGRFAGHAGPAASFSPGDPAFSTAPGA